jgi:hypothetical protein
MRRKYFKTGLHLYCVLLFSFSNFIWAQDITGKIEGRVVDSTGAPLFGVNISLQSKNMQGLRGTTTDDEGHFRLFALPIGSYEVKISFVGYRDIIFENVQVNLGKTTNLGRIQLLQQTYNLPEVVVSGEKFSIDPTSTTYGGNLNAREFENLPVDRNYRSMVSLLPQANTSYFGDEANIGGATGLENKYFVDGVEVTDPLIGGSGTNLPYNFIKEIEVKAGGYDVASRSSLGGLLNVVTHSGSNEFHGSLFGFYTSNRLMENRRFGLLDVNQGDFSNYDLGFGLGGPIIRDNLWFYLAYNPTFNSRDVEVPSFSTSIDKTITHSFAAKLNWRASEKLKLVFTTTGDPTKRDAVGRGINVPPSALGNPDPYFQDIVEGGINYSISGIFTISKNILLEGLLARVDRHDTGKPATGRGESEIAFEDYLNNIWSGGVGSSWDSFRHSNTGRITGTVVLGDHIVNAGIEYKTNSVNNIYDYHSIVRNDSVYYGESIGKGFGEVHNRIPSVFIQDSWKILPGLTLNLGFRWEDQTIIGSDGNVAQNISLPILPQIGFVYLPGNDDRQRIFGSYGRYSQEFGLFQSVNYYSGNGYSYWILFDHDPRLDNTGGDTLYNFPHVIRPEIKDLRGQYYDEFSIGYERSFGQNFKVSIQGIYRTIGEAIDDVFLVDENRYQFGNPGRGILSEWPRPQRDYTALVLSVERHLDERFNFIASYVLSRDYGNYEGLYNTLFHDGFPNESISFDDLTTSRQNAVGLLPNDRTHVFKFSGSYRFPFSLIVGISFIAQSGTPLSEFTGTAGYGIKFLSQRGSAGKTPAIWDLNARFMYELNFLSPWQSKLILDVFHIASQREPVDIDQRHYFNADENGNPFNPNPTYGQAFRYQSSMSVRLGIEVSF